MQIITISRGCEIYGEAFARSLATKLGYLCISREDILKEAKRRRISLEKLEAAVIKPHLFSEELAVELDHYKALAASILCEKALKHNIVYYGRIGHIWMEAVTQKLKLSKDEARLQIEQRDTNMKKWVKMYYKIECDNSTLYDMIINLSHLNIENAATAVCSMAQLPEFYATPAIVKAIQNLYLASRAQLLLAADKRTRKMNIKIKANDSVLYVIYLAQQIQQAGIITDILAKLKDAKEIICTAAETNILWIQEKFDPEDVSYKEVLSLVTSWDAAVELLQINPTEKVEKFNKDKKIDEMNSGKLHKTSNRDYQRQVESEDFSGITQTYNKLINSGNAGGKRIISGSKSTLVDVIDRRIQYRLIILDHIFVSKRSATQIRLLREWANFLSENLEIPVLSINEIRSKYKFGVREIIRMLLYAVLTTLLILLVFKFEDNIITLFSKGEIEWKIITMIGVFAFVPLFAYVYSTVIRLFFKMMKFE
jgi:cytidylate kinase